VLASYGKKRKVESEGKEEVPKVRRLRKKRGQGKQGGRIHGRPCGKLLAAMIRGMIDFLVSSKEPG
jgi:hypothetical protein